MKIYILEDEISQAEQLERFLIRYQQEHSGFNYVLEIYDRAMNLLNAYSGDVDVLFLDIQIPDILGIEVAKRIREIDENVVIIFVTNLAQYAIDGYSVRALDYVLKPLAYEPFAAKMDRILRIYSHQSSGTILDIRTKQKNWHIPSGKITYIEVVGHDIYIHTTGSHTIKCWGNLSDYERQLQNDRFVRCNSCYLVNLKYIQGIDGNDVMVDGKKLTISRPRRKEFLRQLAQYRGGSR